MRRRHINSLILIGGFFIGIGFVLAFVGGMVLQAKTQSAATQTIYVPGDEEQAEETLGTFLTSLYAKDYTKASKFFGGDYDTLRRWNPNLDPNDLASLWRFGCEENGLNCLEIRNMRFASRPDPETFNYNVWFSSPDKRTTFETRGQEAFLFTVKKQGETYLVVTPPVYTE